MKVVVVSEFYPRQGDPVLGVWAHRQALAARDAGAEVKVIVLHRLVPPRTSFSQGPGGPSKALRNLASEPRKQTLDGLDIAYVRYVSPPRARHYQAWGAWATPALGLALRRMRRSFRFDLVHAHNAVPAADAVRRALNRPRRLDLPIVVSVHGGDVLYTAPRSEAGRLAVQSSLATAAGDACSPTARGIAELARTLQGAWRTTKSIHLGADLPESGGNGAISNRRWSRSAIWSLASAMPT